MPATPRDSALLTDLYQLTMLQGYFDHGMNEAAVFEFFIRRLPEQRNFFVAAGLEQAVEYLRTLRFTGNDIDTLKQTGLFHEKFLDSLREFRFTGDVDAMPEGTVFFANEPILRVAAPLPAAQFVESRLVNILHFQTLIASKAARCVLAVPDKPLVDFGMRRAHGSEAAAYAARASYLTGFAGTSNVLAKPLFDIPIFGTMAHSFIQAHDTEIEAFTHFAESHQGAVVLLIDTYDTETGAHRVVDLAKQLPDGAIQSVRLDSGNLDKLARRVRTILDDAGCNDIRIFASGSLDEHKLQALELNGAPIDGYGIGTSLDVSEDCPAFDCVYKLQEYAGTPRRKRSPGKSTWPGRKQVFRCLDKGGHLFEDTLTLMDDTAPGEPLLHPVLRTGERVIDAPDLEQIRLHASQELLRLPDALRSLATRADYSVKISPALQHMAASVDAQFF